MVKTNKAYPVQKVRSGNGKTGEYTVIKIQDAKRNEDGSWSKDYYSVYVNANIDIYVNGKISFSIIDGVTAKTRDYNGKTYYDCTIYVNSENLVIEDIGGEKNDAHPVREQELPF